MSNTDNIDFSYALSKINEPLKEDILLQESILESERLNTTFETLEFNLNKLYENTRFLENAIDYCEAFLELKIQDYSAEIKNILKSIENIRDINKNQGYIEYLIPFIDDSSIKKDRDDSRIPDAYNSNGYIMMSTKNEEHVSMANITKKSSYVAYNDNIKDLLNNNRYNAFYIEDNIANAGISETITITLQQPTKINYAFIDIVNCDIENFRLVYANGIEDYVEYTNGFFNEAVVSQIKFDINTKRYRTSTYLIEKDKMMDDLWNKIKEFEFNISLQPDTKMEMEGIIARLTQNADKENSSNIYNNTINSKNIVEKTMYQYMFGINSIDIKYVEQNMDSCFISQSVNIGQINQNEYIQLHVDDSVNDNACIEYYLLDGDIEIPIAPSGMKIIKNEKLFSSLQLRFPTINGTEVTIKKDGMLTNISLDDAKTQILSRFSADYLTSFQYNYTPINSNIRVKAVIRRYTSRLDNSFISSLKIRKYGGEALWTDI